MSCTETNGYLDALAAAKTAIENQQFVEFFSCMYSAGTGQLVVVGTFFWFLVVSMSFIRTGGDVRMPVIYTFLFGGVALTQVANPVLGMAAVLVLGAMALGILLVARRAETP